MTKCSSSFTLVFLLTINALLAVNSAFNCSEPAIPSDFDVGSCCRLPQINMGDAREKCHQHVESLRLPHENAYVAYAHMCFSECVYRETGTLKDGEIVLDNVKSFLEKNIETKDAAVVPYIVNSFDNCISSIKGHMSNVGINVLDQLPGGCSPFPGLVYGCVDAETFLNCPDNMWKSDEPNCEKAKNYGQHCNPLPHVPLPLPIADEGQQ